jgi:hypothetical protein
MVAIYRLRVDGGNHHGLGLPTQGEKAAVTFGSTRRTLQMEFGGGAIKYTICVPAGTRVRATRDSQEFFVDDLSWLDSGHIVYGDAVHYGIRVPAHEVVPL